MAEDKGKGPFNQPKVGYKNRKDLPKGEGNGKTNAQLFGMFGKVSERLSTLNRSVLATHDGVVQTMREEFNTSHTLSKSQLETMTAVQASVDSLATSLLPLGQLAEEAREGRAGDSDSGTQNKNPFNKLLFHIFGNKERKQVQDFDKSLKELNQTMEKMGGKGGGFLGGAALTGGAVGLARGGSMGAAAGGAVGGLLGAMGLGVGILTGALYLGAAAVDRFGRGLTNTAQGLEDLNNVTLDVSNFYNLNDAILALIDGVGPKDSIGFKIFSGSAFNNMADGLNTLNQLKLDTTVFKDIGMAIEEVGTKVGILKGFGLQIFTGTAFEKLSAGLETLNATEIDADNMAEIGKGLGSFAKESNPFWTNIGAIGNATTIQMLGKVSWKNLAEGLDALNKVGKTDPNLEQNLTNMGQSLAAFILTLTEDELFDSPYKDGSKILTTLGDKDALGKLAKGLKELSTIGNTESVKQDLINLGEGLAALIASTDNYFGTTSLVRMNKVKFQDLADGLATLQGLASKMVEYTDPEGNTKLVRNSEIMADDFNLIATSMESLNDSVDRMGVKNLTNLAVSRGSFFNSNQDYNVLEEISAGLTKLNEIPDFDPEQFKKISDSLYFLVTGSRGQSLLDEFQQYGLTDDDTLDKILATADRVASNFISIFTGGNLQQVAEALITLGPALKNFREVDEEATDNFSYATNAMKVLMESLDNDAINSSGNYSKLNNFISAVNKMDTDKMINLSEIADSLGVSVRGQPISQAQVDALRSSVIQSLIASNIVDASTVNQFNATTPTYQTNYTTSGASVIPMQTIVTK